jgi:hypothetical protein
VTPHGPVFDTYLQVRLTTHDKERMESTPPLRRLQATGAPWGGPAGELTLLPPRPLFKMRLALVRPSTADCRITAERPGL